MHSKTPGLRKFSSSTLYLIYYNLNDILPNFSENIIYSMINLFRGAVGGVGTQSVKWSIQL